MATTYTESSPPGGTEHQSGLTVALAAGAGVTICPASNCADRVRLKMHVKASGDGPFNLDFMIGVTMADKSVQWFVANQVVAWAVTPDGSSEAVLTPVYAAELDTPLSFRYRVDLWNPGTGVVNVAWQSRICI